MIQTKTKKALIVISAILSIAIVVLGAYNLFFFDKTNAEITLDADKKMNQNTDQETPAEPSTTIRKALVITDEAVVGARFNSDGKLKYYSKANGNVLSINMDGSNKSVLDKTVLNNITFVTWDTSDEYALTNVNTVFYTYNFRKNKATKFDPSVKNIVFSGTNKVVYTQKNSTGTFDLIQSQSNGEAKKTVLNLNSDDISLRSMGLTDKVSYSLNPSAFRSSSLNVISLSTGEVKSILNDKYGLDAIWAPNGKQALISYTKERGGAELELALIDDAGKILKVFPAGTTANKIMWAEDGKYAYYTKSQTQTTSVMPDDYFDQKNQSNREELYQVNSNTLEVKILSTDIGNVDATRLFLNESNSQLFFTNKKDNKIYSLGLTSSL